MFQLRALVIVVVCVLLGVVLTVLAQLVHVEIRFQIKPPAIMQHKSTSDPAVSSQGKSAGPAASVPRDVTRVEPNTGRGEREKLRREGQKRRTPFQRHSRPPDPKSTQSRRTKDDTGWAEESRHKRTDGNHAGGGQAREQGQKGKKKRRPDTQTPADVGVLNEGKDCWEGCQAKQGPCEWCGTGMCCRKGSNGCDGSLGVEGKRHVCTPSPAEPDAPPADMASPTPTHTLASRLLYEDLFRGCRDLYLDVGSNVGVQVRRLFKPPGPARGYRVLLLLIRGTKLLSPKILSLQRLQTLCVCVCVGPRQLIPALAGAQTVRA